MITKEKIQEIEDEVNERWSKLSWIEKIPVEERYKEWFWWNSERWLLFSYVLMSCLS